MPESGYDAQLEAELEALRQRSREGVEYERNRGRPTTVTAVPDPGLLGDIALALDRSLGLIKSLSDPTQGVRLASSALGGLASSLGAEKVGSFLSQAGKVGSFLSQAGKQQLLADKPNIASLAADKRLRQFREFAEKNLPIPGTLSELAEAAISPDSSLLESVGTVLSLPLTASVEVVTGKPHLENPFLDFLLQLGVPIGAAAAGAKIAKSLPKTGRAIARFGGGQIDDMIDLYGRDAALAREVARKDAALALEKARKSLPRRLEDPTPTETQFVGGLPPATPPRSFQERFDEILAGLEEVPPLEGPGKAIPEEALQAPPKPSETFSSRDVAGQDPLVRIQSDIAAKDAEIARAQEEIDSLYSRGGTDNIALAEAIRDTKLRRLIDERDSLVDLIRGPRTADPPPADPDIQKARIEREIERVASEAANAENPGFVAARTRLQNIRDALEKAGPDWGSFDIQNLAHEIRYRDAAAKAATGKGSWDEAEKLLADYKAFLKYHGIEPGKDKKIHDPKVELGQIEWPEKPPPHATVAEQKKYESEVKRIGAKVRKQLNALEKYEAHTEKLRSELQEKIVGVRSRPAMSHGAVLAEELEPPVKVERAGKPKKSVLELEETLDRLEKIDEGRKRVISILDENIRLLEKDPDVEAQRLLGNIKRERDLLASGVSTPSFGGEPLQGGRIRNVPRKIFDLEEELLLRRRGGREPVPSKKSEPGMEARGSSESAPKKTTGEAAGGMKAEASHLKREPVESEKAPVRSSVAPLEPQTEKGVDPAMEATKKPPELALEATKKPPELAPEKVRTELAPKKTRGVFSYYKIGEPVPPEEVKAARLRNKQLGIEEKVPDFGRKRLVAKVLEKPKLIVQRGLFQAERGDGGKAVAKITAPPPPDPSTSTPVDWTKYTDEISPPPPRPPESPLPEQMPHVDPPEGDEEAVSLINAPIVGHIFQFFVNADRAIRPIFRPFRRADYRMLKERDAIMTNLLESYERAGVKLEDPSSGQRIIQYVEGYRDASGKLTEKGKAVVDEKGNPLLADQDALSENELIAAGLTKKVLADAIREMNAVRRSIGLTEIPKRQDYFPHLREQIEDEFEKKFLIQIGLPEEIRAFFTRVREDNRAIFNMNLPEVMDVYVRSYLKKKHYEPILARMVKYDNSGNLVGGEILERYKDNPIKKRYAAEWLKKLVGPRDHSIIERAVDAGFAKLKADLLAVLPEGKIRSAVENMEFSAATAASLAQRAVVREKLGMAPMQFVKNVLGGQVNIMIHRGVSGWLRGAAALAGRGASGAERRALVKAEDLMGDVETVLEEMGRSKISALRRFDKKVGLAGIRAGEWLNRGVAFSTGVEDWIARNAKGKAWGELTKEQKDAAVHFGHLVADETQFIMSTVARSPYMSGPGGRLFSMFAHYPTNMVDFTLEQFVKAAQGIPGDPKKVMPAVRLLMGLGLASWALSSLGIGDFYSNAREQLGLSTRSGQAFTPTLGIMGDLISGNYAEAFKAIGTAAIPYHGAINRAIRSVRIAGRDGVTLEEDFDTIPERVAKLLHLVPSREVYRDVFPLTTWEQVILFLGGEPSRYTAQREASERVRDYFENRESMRPEFRSRMDRIMRRLPREAWEEDDYERELRAIGLEP